MKTKYVSIVVVLVFLLSGCASFFSHAGTKQAASLVDYLYPDAKEVPQMQATVTYLRPPVRVGIAFVPGGGWGAGISEVEKLKLLERVKASFAKYEYIGNIEVIPSQYLRPKGGFENMDQVARMFNVEVVALLSYDQVQFNDTNALSVLYWTIVGAYIIEGDKFDVQTMVDASVFDIRSHKLLFRAPGTRQVKGSATLAGFAEHARAGQLEGYNKAVDQLIPQLQSELGNFKERIKSDAGFKVANKPGYIGGGDLGWLNLLLVLVLAGVGYATRRAS
jgi:rhombotail lipoprotein